MRVWRLGPALGALLTFTLTSTGIAASGVPKPVQPPAQTSAAIPDDYFTRDVKPLNVQPVPDEDNRFSDSIGPDGGQLVTLDAAGNTYTLTVPKGALGYPERLSMTPLSDLKGMPFKKGLNVGVQLEPEGTFFVRPVTLEIAFAKQPDLKTITPFDYTGAGQDFTSTMLKPAPGHFIFVLNHFSGAGFANSSEAERTAELVRQPVDAQERISKALVEQLGEERLQQLLGQHEGKSSDILQAVLRTMNAFEKQVLAPLREAAPQSCSAGTMYMQTLLGVERQRQMFGGGEGMETLMGKLYAAEKDATGKLGTSIMQKIRQKCLEEEIKICDRTGDIFRLVQWRIGVERQVQLLLGSEETTQDDKDLNAQYANGLKSCSHFEMQLHSSLTQKGDINSDLGFVAGHGTTDYNAHLDIMLPLKIASIGWLGAPSELPNGKDALIYTTYRLSEVTHSDVALAQTDSGTLGVTSDCTVKGTGTTPGQVVATLVPQFKPAPPGDDLNAADPNLAGLSPLAKRVLPHIPRVGLLAPPRVLDVEQTLLYLDVGTPTEHINNTCNEAHIVQPGDLTTWLDAWNDYWSKRKTGAQKSTGGAGWTLNPWDEKTTGFPLSIKVDVPKHEDAGGINFDQNWHLDITIVHTPKEGP